MRRVLTALMAVIVMFMLIAPIKAQATCPDDVLAYMNAERSAAGLPGFTVDDTLSDIAAVRAVECSTRFSHIRPNGMAWYTVSKSTNGENLAHAVNANQQKPENVVLAWMLSPTHKANVLRETFSAVGIAYYYSDNGETYIVCEFR
ncbi:CAP domain-containing protein [Butyrivibrio sp. AE3009]|uniref:CAP domain-containing protein n=1 Tax=Butyrivibrio sp. AE3009 TaxID=1280666 RepID=UPI0003B6180D|nr:CAP domain-containing protein [Butyrivibrio sp. AE3009]